MKDKEIEALIKKTTGKSGIGRKGKSRFVDPTLEATRKQDVDPKEGNESQKLFKEMKKRAF